MPLLYILQKHHPASAVFYICTPDSCHIFRAAIVPLPHQVCRYFCLHDYF